MALDAHVTNILLQMDALVSYACSNIMLPASRTRLSPSEFH